MSRKWRKRRNGDFRLNPETVNTIWAFVAIGAAIVLILSGINRAGPAGDMIYRGLNALVGFGYFAVPAAFLFVSATLLFSRQKKVVGITFFGMVLVVLSVLGLLDLASPGNGGVLGKILGSLKFAFGEAAASVISFVLFAIGIVTTLNVPVKLRWREKVTGVTEVVPPQADLPTEDPEDDEESEGVDEEEKGKPAVSKGVAPVAPAMRMAKAMGTYAPPPLSLLKSSIEKPTTGDLRANANIIRRTLESFGIAVEMGEINIGPAVTRYTLKPAEGVKISRILALNQDLALALAAHPIRIEAPIPGKSLVGIEVPNKSAALVRLGSLLAYKEFSSLGPLAFVVGRDVSGEPIFADIGKMPHLLVAGSTGSGKSVVIHSLITSLIYKNSPETLRLVLVDPKRVELSVYEGIPHLASPVIIDNKKAISVFRWAIKEMLRRYELFLRAGNKDIKSYLKNGKTEEPLPYILIIIDEVADLMNSYGREVEGAIIRLAQMARATGIHLVLSTQRPSVEVITGLIKANITGRIALQVASQIDSRTILDSAGAEKLLGSGDLLFVTAELAKPKRIQGSYVTEEEVVAVTDFIREHNIPEEDSDFAMDVGAEKEAGMIHLDEDALSEEPEDELYDTALALVAESQRVAATFLQRKLRIGYARAARLIDTMEKNGAVGPERGSKLREVYVPKPQDMQNS